MKNVLTEQQKKNIEELTYEEKLELIQAILETETDRYEEMQLDIAENIFGWQKEMDSIPQFIFYTDLTETDTGEIMTVSLDANEDGN